MSWDTELDLLPWERAWVSSDTERSVLLPWKRDLCLGNVTWSKLTWLLTEKARNQLFSYPYLVMKRPQHAFQLKQKESHVMKLSRPTYKEMIWISKLNFKDTNDKVGTDWTKFKLNKIFCKLHRRKMKEIEINVTWVENTHVSLEKDTERKVCFGKTSTRNGDLKQIKFKTAGTPEYAQWKVRR